MNAQHIWTPSADSILQFLIDKNKAGYRIVTISPHMDHAGYLVIGEETDISRHIEHEQRER